MLAHTQGQGLHPCRFCNCHKDRSTDKYPQHSALLDEHSIKDMEDDIDQYRAAKDFSKLESPSKDTPIAIPETFLLGSVKR